MKKKPLPTGITEYEEVIKFTPTFKWPGSNRTLTFDGDDFQNWIVASLPMCRGMIPTTPGDAARDGHRIDDEFVFYLREFPMWRLGSAFEGLSWFSLPSMNTVAKRNTLSLHRGDSLAACAFSTMINIPILARGIRAAPWMSLTPNEVYTQRGQIRRAKKNTGMAGLGMGWAARQVLERKQVDHLTVYEESAGIIDFFGAPLLADFPDRVTLVCTDAYKVDWMQHDVALWDIWEDYGDAEWDRAFKGIQKRMMNAGKVCVGWGKGGS